MLTNRTLLELHTLSAFLTERSEFRDHLFRIEETCLWRVEAVRQLKEITKQAEMVITYSHKLLTTFFQISRFRLRRQITIHRISRRTIVWNIWILSAVPLIFDANASIFRVDRAKERFKERVEAAIGEDIVARVIKIGDGIRELNEYDAKVSEEGVAPGKTHFLDENYPGITGKMEGLHGRHPRK